MATPEDCKKCAFRGSVTGGSIIFCNYLGKMGRRRPYKAKDCRLYKVKVKKNDR